MWNGCLVDKQSLEKGFFLPTATAVYIPSQHSSLQIHGMHMISSL